VIERDASQVLDANLCMLASADPLGHIVDHHLFGSPYVTIHMVYVGIAAILTVLVMTSAAKRVVADGTGGRLGGFFETIMLYIRDEVSRPFLGKEGDKYLWIIWSFFFFILFNNLVGLLPEIGRTSTANLSVTGGLAAVAFCTYHGIGIKKNGFFRYMKAAFLVGPWPLWPMMIGIEFLGHVIKPAALAVRLFANMVAGHTMLAVIFGFTAGGMALGVVCSGSAVLLTFLELLVACIQAFIFTFLTTVFLSMAIHPDH